MSNNDNLARFMEELKAKNDIVSVVSRYVPLQRKGRLFWGRCPFHGEKTPSFAVNADDQFYHCFGCGVGGDVVKFVMEIESIDFMGAIHILADMARMEVPSFSGVNNDEGNIKKRKEQKDRLVALMKETAMHYVENLKSPKSRPAAVWFENRNISPQVARTFGLGYSLNYYDLINHLTSKGYTLEEMKTAGVVKIKDDGKPYDAIGGRVVFPIIDTSFNVIAFGGRTLEAKPNFAKYLNTADTPLFDKSKNLYAINLVKKAKMNSAKIDHLIIVEGYMDVISLHKAGFTTAVASMGTALTNEQAKLMKRFTDKVYICYDGDTAGKKATLRGLDILKDCGLDVYVMSMPEGLDPDDVINKYGAEGYRRLMEKALPLIDFKLEFLKKLYDVTTSEGKTKYVNEAIEVLNSLSEVEREVYISKVSDISGIMKDFIKRQTEKNKNQNQSNNFARNTTVIINSGNKTSDIREKIPADNKVIQAEKFVLSAMVHSKPYAYSNTDISEYFTEERVDFYKTIKEISNNYPEKDIKKVFYEKYLNVDENIEPETEINSKISKAEKASEIINYMLKNSADESELTYFKDCLFLIYKNYAENKIRELGKRLESEIEKEKRTDILVEMKILMSNIKNKKVDI